MKFATMFYKNSHFLSNQILNSLRTDRIFTQHPTICEECGGSMERVKRNGISKKLSLMYPQEYLWWERNDRDEPTAFINILSHISDNDEER